MKYITFLITVLLFVSCKETGKDRMNRLVQEWSGKEIVYPRDLHFTSLGRDTTLLLNSGFTIMTYVDSIGCVSCKLQLPQWKRLISEIDSFKNTSFLFVFHPKDIKNMNHLLKRDNFTHPVCLDMEDSFNKLNKLPSEMMFQTFLLDKEHKVIGIGNPIHNPKIKELYLKIISGDKAPTKESKIQTIVACSKPTVDLGKFDWKQEKTAHFTLANRGNSPLVVIDAVTSCGCTSVTYHKEPVQPGSSVELAVRYQADHPEYFNKTITVYCNSASSPLKLTIKGSAE